MIADRAREERSAGGVVIRRIEDEVHSLLIRDAYGKWGLPKGHLEGDETPREAAIREVSEETGLEILVPGAELGTIDWYFRQDGRLIHKFCDYFLMHSPRGEAMPETEEGITDVVWLSMPDAVETVAYDNARTVVKRAWQMVEEGEADELLGLEP